ncbi:MAG: metallophosphoesterase, partial [Clostridia bacterium]|nr:metallophosphoesterase [Clostridia bacterium]
MLVGCGEAGPKGDTGATGPAGPQGVAGSSFLTDEGVPTSADGANGDLYLDTTTFNLYKKVDGVWTELGNIKGEQGEPGNPGEPGTPAVAPTVEINNDGYWIINGVPTEQKAQGEAGATPTVEINDDGYWVINGQVSQVKAEALDGTKGADGNIWTVGTEYPTTSNNGDMFLNNSTWNVYQYNGEEWVLKGNIKGQDGTSGDGSVAVEEILPSYWMSYLDTKIAEINAKSESYGYNADAFICITDQHLDGSKDYAAAVINYITERTSIKKVIFGGDTLQGGDNDKELLRDYINSFNDDLTVLGMRGNHDNWGNVDDKAYYDIVLRPLAEKIERLDDLYYCYDNDDQKIRYIITDSTYTASDGSSNLTSTEQLDWMKEKILELDSEWTTVVFHHGIYTSADI